MKTTQTLLLAATLSVGLFAATAANANLVGSADGKTVYDTDLNLTWLSNANLAATNTFGLSYGVDYGTDILGWSTIIYSNGTMTTKGAVAWVTALNAANYLGYNDWRLPQNDPFCLGYNCSGYDMGDLYYDELGGVAGYGLSSRHNANYDLFNNLQTTDTNSGYSIQYAQYWTGTMTMQPYQAGLFGMNGGYQSYNVYGQNAFTMVVRSGQVSTVPVPAASWLLGSGLLGLVGVARRKAV